MCKLCMLNELFFNILSSEIILLNIMFRFLGLSYLSLNKYSDHNEEPCTLPFMKQVLNRLGTIKVSLL